MPIDAINFHEQAIRDKNSTPVLLIRDRVDGKIWQADAEPSTGIQRVQNMVWDPILMQPVRMTQPTINIDGDLDVTVGDVEALLANRYFQATFPYLHASGRPQYICKNLDIDANLTDTDWYIWKYTDAAIPRSEGPRFGAINTVGVINALPWNF